MAWAPMPNVQMSTHVLSINISIAGEKWRSQPLHVPRQDP